MPDREKVMLTHEAICKGLSALKNAYKDENTDFDISYLEGTYGEGQHIIRVSVINLISDALALLKEQEVMVKPTKCPCGELFDAKDSSFCPKCGCAYGELSGRYTNIGR